MASQLEKFEVRNRRTGNIQFTAEISVTENMLPSVKLGLAVKWAICNGANLSGADLSSTNLRGTNLRGTDLSGTDLRDAYLSGANLSSTNLSGANLRGANLSRANLSGTDLSGADLSGADLRDCPVKIENIHQKIYESASADSALNMGDWHSCLLYTSPSPRDS